MTTQYLRESGSWVQINAASTNPPPPSSVPGAPTGVSAVAGNGSATVSWTAPASDGGSPIIDYTITSNPGSATLVVSAPSTSGLVSPLSNGTAYTFTVTARNSVGSSPASAASSSVTPTAPPPSYGYPYPYPAWTGDPTTFDWKANTGLRTVTGKKVKYGSVTIDSTTISSLQSGGSGTAADPWIVDNLLVRNDPSTNAIGDPLNAKTAFIFMQLSNVKLVNCKAPAIMFPQASGNVDSCTVEFCETGIFDYFGGPQPTTDRYTGNPIGQTPFRQFWWDEPNCTAYYYEPGDTRWRYAGESWRYVQYLYPTTPAVGEAIARCNQGGQNGSASGWKAIAYQRWNGTTWADISATVCPDVVYLNDGYSYGGITCSSNNTTVTNLTVQYNTIVGIEDAFSPIPPLTRIRYNWFRTNWTTRAKCQPHGDFMQAVPLGGNLGPFTVQRNFFDGVTYYRKFNPAPATMGAEFSSAGIWKDASFNDVLYSENWLRWHSNNWQVYSITLKNGSAAQLTNFRFRNNVFDTLGDNVVVLYNAGGGLGQIAWTNNRDENGNAVPVGTRGAASAYCFDDGDPNGEGTTLR